MLQVGGDLDLFEEPLGAEDGCEFGPQHFHRHLAVVLQVLGEIDRGHAARAEFFLDGVAVGEGGFETVEGVGHEGLRYGSVAVEARGGQAISECRLQIADLRLPFHPGAQ